MPIGIYIEYTAHPWSYNELLAGLTREAEACIRDDDGCLRMEVAVPVPPDGRIFLIELWRDRVAIDGHRSKSGHSHEWQDPLVASKRVSVCQVIDSLKRGALE